MVLWLTSLVILHCIGVSKSTITFTYSWIPEFFRNNDLEADFARTSQGLLRFRQLRNQVSPYSKIRHIFDTVSQLERELPEKNPLFEEYLFITDRIKPYGDLHKIWSDIYLLMLYQHNIFLRLGSSDTTARIRAMTHFEEQYNQSTILHTARAMLLKNITFRKTNTAMRFMNKYSLPSPDNLVQQPITIFFRGMTLLIVHAAGLELTAITLKTSHNPVALDVIQVVDDYVNIILALKALLMNTKMTLIGMYHMLNRTDEPCRGSHRVRDALTEKYPSYDFGILAFERLYSSTLPLENMYLWHVPCLPTVFTFQSPSEQAEKIAVIAVRKRVTNPNWHQFAQGPVTMFRSITNSHPNYNESVIFDRLKPHITNEKCRKIMLAFVLTSTPGLTRCTAVSGNMKASDDINGDYRLYLMG